jgi:hypothetical protein
MDNMRLTDLEHLGADKARNALGLISLADPVQPEFRYMMRDNVVRFWDLTIEAI